MRLIKSYSKDDQGHKDKNLETRRKILTQKNVHVHSRVLILIIYSWKSLGHKI